MFKRMASDLLGISDIGKIISPADYDKVASDDYIMHEDNEKIFFLIKSKTDEYCFTNLALIHLDGDSAISSKRMLHRYDYFNNSINGVRLETAGTVDLDVEIKFSLSGINFSIDVDKNQIEQLKDLYKALICISKTQISNETMFGHARKSLELGSSSVSKMTSTGSVSEEFSKVVEDAFDFLKMCQEQFVQQDFTEIFTKYINN